MLIVAAIVLGGIFAAVVHKASAAKAPTKYSGPKYSPGPGSGAVPGVTTGTFLGDLAAGNFGTTGGFPGSVFHRIIVNAAELARVGYAIFPSNDAPTPTDGVSESIVKSTPAGSAVPVGWLIVTDGNRVQLPTKMWHHTSSFKGWKIYAAGQVLGS